jgi:hypothetical protein
LTANLLASTLGHEAGSLFQIDGQAVQLLCGCNVSPVQLASRLRPTCTANPDLAERSGTLPEQPMGCHYFLEPSVPGAELVYFQALQSAAIVFVTVRQPSQLASVEQYRLQPLQHVGLEPLSRSHRLEILDAELAQSLNLLFLAFHRLPQL